MNEWRNELKYDPVRPLLESGNEAICVFTSRDLLNKKISFQDLWELPEAQRLLRKQKPEGYWSYPGGNEDIRSRENYDQLETYRNLGLLVEEFGFDRKHPAISKAAKFLFGFQTREGDFRGIYGNQYTPNYSAGIAELLIKAGYENDPRIKKVFKWLLTIRQQDGGWAIPLRTRNRKLDAIAVHAETLEPDPLKPFSYMVTAVVLRAFAAHPVYRQSQEARQAGELVLSRFFEKDNYPDRGDPSYWLRFSFPFWFADLISALDSLSQLGFSRTEPQIAAGLQWFVANQQADGLWDLKILKGRRRDITRLWLALAICRIFKRFDAAEIVA
jgi:Squalene-hopene cyclase C-terminal domain